MLEEKNEKYVNNMGNGIRTKICSHANKRNIFKTICIIYFLQKCHLYIRCPSGQIFERNMNVNLN